jgi:LmbE family N-acetylglucosaminyl deacetylase
MRPRRQFLPGHVVVVSPHLDDAVLSLGATIARATRSLAHVEVLTVFAGDPASGEPAGGWDTRAGFATEGEATLARRLEDYEACRRLGAETTWLSFPGGSYAGERGEQDAEAIWTSIAAAVAGADTVIIPGFPLTNRDHAWLRELIDQRGLPSHTGLYAEQPYRYMIRRERSLSDVEWETTGVTIADYRRKWSAILSYTSQLPLLGFTARRHRKLKRLLLHEMLKGGEALASLPPEPAPS